MFPSHLARMLAACINGDFSDAQVRDAVRMECIPALSRYRREITAGSFPGRHARPAGFMKKSLAKARAVRFALAHAHQQLLATGYKSNVVSFNEARQSRRTQDLAEVV